MLRPRLLGSLIILYVIFYKLWELTFVVWGARPGDHIDDRSYLVVAGYALIAFLGLVLLCYTTGSVGLLLRRKWSAVVVFYTAIGEATILLFAGVLFIYMTVERAVAGLTPLDVLPFLLLLVFPIGLGFAARSLRRNPELWQSPHKESLDRAEPPRSMEADLIRPAWRQRMFRVVLGTGLFLPVALALIAMTISLIQERPFAISGGTLFIFLLVSVLFALPYVVLAFIVRAVLGPDWEERGSRPARRLFVLVGIFVGMTAVIAPSLYACFVDAEVAGVLIFAPYWPFMIALPGVVAGALVGLIAFYVRDFYRRLRDSSGG